MATYHLSKNKKGYISYRQLYMTGTLKLFIFNLYKYYDGTLLL